MTYNLAQLFVEVADQLASSPRRTLNALAGTLGVDRHTIEISVRRATGHTFRQYQKARILELGVLLLERESHLSIKEIAITLGYRSINSFGRFIKSNLAKSPTDLRRRAFEASMAAH